MEEKTEEKRTEKEQAARHSSLGRFVHTGIRQAEEEEHEREGVNSHCGACGARKHARRPSRRRRSRASGR